MPSCLFGSRKASTALPLDVVDVLPLQLQNLRNKLPPGSPVRLLTMNAVDLSVPDCSYERTLVFFLLHEQLEAVRRRTLQEALRAALTWFNIEWMNGSRLEPDPHPD